MEPEPKPEIVEVIEIIEIVEIEEFAKRGEHVPHAKHYAFRVDKERVVVTTPTITGTEILAKVGKTPEAFKLYQHKRHHQPVLIGPHEVVDLRAHGVERFTTMPKDTTEGLVTCSVHQDFRLPAADEEYLEGLGLSWEARKHNESQWLVIHTWKLPPGYNRETAKLALLIPPGYSDSQIDMVHFSPALARNDGKPIGGLSASRVGNESFQQWSRHRTQKNPWRIGIDDVASHLALVDDWLRREFEKA